MDSLARYSRLKRFAGFAATLPLWQAQRCAVVGLGGLGGGLALHLARLGVARLVLVDRDTVDFTNLGHQALFTDEHAAQGLPKAEAARQTLSMVNSAVDLVPVASEVTRRNIASLLDGCTLVFDGLDNYYTRFVLNDWCLKARVPYFYAGVVRGELSARAVIPGVTGCLRCLLDGPPPAGSIPTCAAEGVFPPLLGVANALQLDAANRFLAGSFTAADDVLYSLSTADWQLRQVRLGGPRPGCPACGDPAHPCYDYLDGARDALAQGACAADRLELDLPPGGVELDPLARRLAGSGFAVRRNAYCIVAEQSGLSYTVFASGKIVLSGSADPVVLSRFVATYLGV